jgi:hypothetical protein
MSSLFQLRRELHRQEPLSVYYVAFEPTDAAIVASAYVIAGSTEEADSIVRGHHKVNSDFIAHIEQTNLTTLEELLGILLGTTDVPYPALVAQMFAFDITSVVLVDKHTALGVDGVTAASGRQISQAVTVL